jgi:tetratricopeptide (TPR) repeat protein
MLLIYQELSESNQDKYLNILRENLNGLADIFYFKKQFKALQFYIEVVSIAKKNIKVSPEKYLFHIAGILSNIGHIYVDAEKTNKAKESYIESIYYFDKLVELNSTKYLPLEVFTISNLANLCKETNDLGNAYIFTQKLLSVYRILVKQDRNKFLPLVANTLNDLSNLQRKRNELENTLASINESLSIYKELAADNPQIHMPNVGMTLINMGVFYQKNKIDKKLSIEFVDEAITLLLPFNKIGYNKNYLKAAFTVLRNWNIDVEAYLKEKSENNEEE